MVFAEEPFAFEETLAISFFDDLGGSAPDIPSSTWTLLSILNEKRGVPTIYGMLKNLSYFAMDTRKNRCKELVPRDDWFGVTFDEARIQNLREAQDIPLINKLAWLDEARMFARKTATHASTRERLTSPQICNTSPD